MAPNRLATKFQTARALQHHDIPKRDVTINMQHIICSVIIMLTAFDINQARTGPPKILFQPQRHIYYSSASNSSIELACSADGSTPIRFFWEKNGVLVKFREIVSGNGIFDVNHQINDPTLSDEGEYICYVSNDFGDAMTYPVHLTHAVLQDHSNRNIAFNETADVNHPYTLPCEVPHSIPEAEVYWVKVTGAGVAASQQQRIQYDERVTSDTNGNLHVIYVLSTDTGSYRCVIYNSLLRIYTNGPIFNIKIRDGVGSIVTPPELIWNSDEYPVALHGSDVKLRCIVGGRPAPYIVWTNADTGAAMRTDQVIDYGRTLTLNNVRFIDAGRYQCSVPGTSLTSGAIFTLEVDKAPTWIRKPNPIKANVGEDVVFNCSAYGKPEPTIKWYIDSTPLADVQGDKRPSRIQNTQLTGATTSLLFFRATSSFTLICEAYNTHDYIWDGTFLYVPGNTLTSPTPSTQAPTQAPSTPNSGAKSSNAATIGGSIGGVVAVISAIVVLSCIWSRARKRKQPETKSNVNMAYRNRGFDNVQQQVATGGKGEAYNGLSDSRDKEPKGNIYDELGGASNVDSSRNEEAEYCYISDSDIIAAQRQSGKPIPSVRNNRSSGPDVSNPGPTPVSASVGYSTAYAPSGEKRLSHFPSGKYSSLDNPVYRGQTGNTNPPAPAEYEEPKTTHEYFVLEPEHTSL
ncbi:neural cell adhesion molecule L1-like [Ylistrum balloti]|uniref:neural cell adhesion molecule L1-like n=1 Tax=Ylistrum balloti TaxID=509963 RepID=UPI002905BE06|nr:neural cell adhesion molecule L1-like [Ylistrum balloti]